MKNPEIPPEIDKDFLVGMFRAYTSMMGYSLSAENVDEIGAFVMGRGRAGRVHAGHVRIERVDESGEKLCDCLVQPGGEVDIVYSMLDSAFGDGAEFDIVHHFEKIGLGKIRSLPELTVKLAAAVG